MNGERHSPVVMDKQSFTSAGYRLVDDLAKFFDEISALPVTTGETPLALQAIIGNESLPEEGQPAGELLLHATDMLVKHSLFNGHPKFAGYITSSPAPIGALADMLAAAINPNVGANVLSPIATEIERQTIRWLSEFIGLPVPSAGILVSGGNMANFTGFLAGRTAKAPANIKADGIGGSEKKLLVYCSKATHTWVEKAVVLFGLGTNAIRWIETDDENRILADRLEDCVANDLRNGFLPIMAIGTVGDVSTGAVDDLQAIASVCKKYDLWFHVDGAYGMPAAVLPELKDLFAGIEEADSIAIDPHKWLYATLEAGCTLVKDPNTLTQTFSSHPVYYNFDQHESMTLNFYEYGLQNSRGFRALKVWLMLQQVGRNGYRQMISDDIALSKLLYKLASDHEELEAVTQSLSITTFRFVPKGIDGGEKVDMLNALNESLLNRLQREGRAFLSNAVTGGKYCLRHCIVNFRTSEKDIHEIIDIVVEAGRSVYEEMKQQIPMQTRS